MRYIALVLFGAIVGGFSWVAWRLPVQIIDPDIYSDYLVPANGSVVSNLTLFWFFLGGYKTALIMAWDKNESYFTSTAYRVKAFILVPLTPILSWKQAWWKLPSTEYMNNKF
ncbi:TPA: hypothetical protein NVH30_002966 [Vibrio cholerae]|nr:hypothetical protein [Vibrio cholerae]HCJ7280615.1 hypothetical protein [Vibrio cholerae]HCJ7318269.1 hypothetical protein [Vibrio cholerae]